MSILFSSKGIKRLIVGYVSIILEVVRLIPGSDLLVLPLQHLLGFLGASAAVHATTAKTVSRQKLLFITSILSVLITLSYIFPWLAPYRETFEQLAALLAAGGVGATLQEKKDEQEYDSVSNIGGV